MRYTVARLHYELTKLIEQGHGRKPVWIDKETFQHNCEADGCTILPVAGMGVVWVPMADGDGGTAYNRDGTEKGRTALVLAGDAGANRKGELVAKDTESRKA